MLVTRQPHQLHNARALLEWKGPGAAARYMRFCGWSLQAALWWLLGVGAR